MKITIELSSGVKYVYDTDNLNEPFKSNVLRHADAMIEPFEIAMDEQSDEVNMKIEVRS